MSQVSDAALPIPRLLVRNWDWRSSMVALLEVPLYYEAELASAMWVRRLW